MKTTILPGVKSRHEGHAIKDRAIQIANLLLAVQYIIVDLLFISVPVRTGHGGGSGQGIGSAIAISFPAFTILFMLLFLFHLIVIFQARLPVRISLGAGIGQIIAGTLILGLLIFVRQSLHILQTVYPSAITLYPSLASTLILGIYQVIGPLWEWHHALSPDIRNISKFPLPLNRYRNIRQIGEGGAGMIWYAERAGDGLPVVVKVPRKDDEITGMSFMQEISIWKNLEHKNIARLLSANILPVPYIEIEYLPGSVADLDKPVSCTETMRIITGLISALLYAHEKGIIHCDIKPTNILLSSTGTPKLTDWGLARTGQDRWSVSGFSPTYAAPEQRQTIPECSVSSDIWQIGIVWAELLTGCPAMPGGDEPVFQTEKGRKIYAILTKCLAIHPEERYRSVQELSDDLPT
ncbi:MAG TPA: serine/threonine-protein kinase [Methanospirillum sp.]|uniref:serine/threonine-protein kinase n=1 Tax=Methanospirillum sp. TaxID=45200 RepID=UPI002C5EB238|nr:serine/threonine-protein kinase [Methanospirillum sp.]HOJ96391.1 serine/threonine-protein kinase [Methanospirillum sp.]HPP77458.1 serine/threonine-protein kinase [Methanospirillum sp.]